MVVSKYALTHSQDYIDAVNNSYTMGVITDKEKERLLTDCTARR